MTEMLSTVSTYPYCKFTATRVFQKLRKLVDRQLLAK